MSALFRPLALAAALVAAGTLSPTAAQAAPADQHAEILSTIQRDLGWDADQARARLAADERSADTARTLRKRLDDRFGGAWIDSSGTLTVGVTQPSAVDPGVRTKLVQRSESDLDAVKSALDANVAKAPRSVPGWYVDLPTNTVVVKSQPGEVAATRAFVASSGVPASAVRYYVTTEEPRPLIDVIGGNAYNIGSGTRCSVGFSVNGGFVTAGHCGSTGASTSNPSGTFRGSSFPGNDYAWVQVAAGNTPRGLVNNYSGGTVSVAGSQDAQPANSSEPSRVRVASPTTRARAVFTDRARIDHLIERLRKNAETVDAIGVTCRSPTRLGKPCPESARADFCVPLPCSPSAPLRCSRPPRPPPRPPPTPWTARSAMRPRSAAWSPSPPPTCSAARP
jgi:hypothetical protein